MWSRFWLLWKKLTNPCCLLILELGDELYTKVDQNVSPSDSEGWTIVLMEHEGAVSCGNYTVVAKTNSYSSKPLAAWPR